MKENHIILWVVLAAVVFVIGVTIITSKTLLYTIYNTSTNNSLKITDNTNNEGNNPINNYTDVSNDYNYSFKNFSYKNESAINLTRINHTILVSFRIDDIIFVSGDKTILQNALYLARKYNITFDLAVIAQPFDKYKIPEVYNIYNNNRDVFEIVAHGLTHRNPFNSSHDGEFHDATTNVEIPYDIQEQHIQNMTAIFKKYNLTEAQKILVLPWETGRMNTIILAEKYGYRLIMLWYNPTGTSEYTYNNITASNEVVIINMKSSYNNSDIEGYISQINNRIKSGQTKIQIETHPIDFYNTTMMDEIIKDVKTSLSRDNISVNYRFISYGVS